MGADRDRVGQQPLVVRSINLQALGAFTLAALHPPQQSQESLPCAQSVLPNSLRSFYLLNQEVSNSMTLKQGTSNRSNCAPTHPGSAPSITDDTSTRVVTRVVAQYMKAQHDERLPPFFYRNKGSNQPPEKIEFNGDDTRRSSQRINLSLDNEQNK
ncbi:hypothetical protein Pfo_011430 [Paulownia fortunei]|nr:hypothetical protein Pfo_011430 [Paulownia fortunei]